MQTGPAIHRRQASKRACTCHIHHQASCTHLSSFQHRLPRRSGLAQDMLEQAHSLLCTHLQSFSYSRLCQSYAERPYEPLFTCQALVMGDRAVSIRLQHTCHMDTACRASAQTPSPQFLAGFQTYPGWRACTYAIDPRLHALGARKIARARAGWVAARGVAAPLGGFAARAVSSVPFGRVWRSSVFCWQRLHRCGAASLPQPAQIAIA